MGPIGRSYDGALTAIRGAFDEHARAAKEVTSAFTPVSTDAATVSFSKAGRDLASAFVSMTQADTVSGAQVAVLRTFDAMSGELTELVGRPRER